MKHDFMDIDQDGLDLISDIYEVVLDHNVWSDILDRSGRKVGALAMNTLLVDHIQPEIQISATSSRFTPQDVQYFNENHLEDESLAIMALSKHAPGSFVSEKEVYAEIGRDPDNIPTNDWLKEEFGIGGRIATRLNTGPAWLDCLTMHFEADHPILAPENKKHMELMHPHFARVMEITRPFSLLHTRFRAVLTVLDRFHIGTFILSEDGSVIIQNKEAERVLSANNVLRLGVDGHLTGNTDQTSRDLKQAIEVACKTSTGEGLEAGRLLRMQADESDTGILVDIAPLRGTDLVLEEGFRGCLVLVSDPSNPYPISSKGLKLLYGLSEAEEAICTMVIEGMKNEEIAEGRNVSLDTIKTQMKSLYSKTGTQHRLELMKLAQTVNIPIEPGVDKKMFEKE